MPSQTNPARHSGRGKKKDGWSGFGEGRVNDNDLTLKLRVSLFRMEEGSNVRVCVHVCLCV